MGALGKSPRWHRIFGKAEEASGEKNNWDNGIPPREVPLKHKLVWRRGGCRNINPEKRQV